MIGISALTLVPGLVGGSETYVRGLLAGLADVGELEYTVFAPTVAPGLAPGLPTEVVAGYPASRTTLGRLRAMTQAALLPQPLRRELRLERLAALHFPLSLALPPPPEGLPVATTILDLQHEHHPEFFGRAELLYRRWAYGQALRRSEQVVTISEFAKQTIVERLGVEPERVHAIHLAVDHERYRPGEQERQPFLLYPAIRWPHKNHERLFQAFAQLRREQPQLRLLLTGAGHEGKPVPAGVEVLGRVSEERLLELYRTASALVFPSLYEGFGQPPLEAMACGCPVAAAGVTAIPEVCGEAAVLFDPLDPEAIAAGIREALARAPELTAAGIARARRFSWQACARAHDALYRELSDS